MLQVVSVSLGSSKRDQQVETTILGQPIRLTRIGTDGDLARARARFRELDGKVDAFGVGGADLAITVNGRRYPLYSVQSLVEGLYTPAVDGGGVRAVLERQLVQRLETHLPEPIQPRRVLIGTAVARYDLARSFADAGFSAIYGDLGFGLGISWPIRSLDTLHRLAALLLPIMGRLPFSWLYPTGAQQERITPKFGEWYKWAMVIADDFHYIKQHLPARLDGKIIVTNTTTRHDLDLLRSRGVRMVVTSTPRIDGRTFGTNLLEAALVAIAGKGRALTTDELRAMVSEEDLQPTILTF